MLLVGFIIRIYLDARSCPQNVKLRIVSVFDLELQTQWDITLLHVGNPAQFLQNRVCSSAVHFQMQKGGP